MTPQIFACVHKTEEDMWIYWFSFDASQILTLLLDYLFYKVEHYEIFAHFDNE